MEDEIENLDIDLEAEESPNETAVEQIKQEELKPSVEIVPKTSTIKPESKPEKEKKIDLTKLNEFKNRIISDFGLTEHIDSHGCYTMKYEGFVIIKLLPRKNCWYGVWKEIPEENNKWRAVRVHNEEEEQAIYEHVKKLVELNSQPE